MAAPLLEFRFTVKHLSLSLPEPEGIKNINCKLFLNNVKRQEVSLTDSGEKSSNKWCLSSDLHIPARKNSDIDLTLSISRPSLSLSCIACLNLFPKKESVSFKFSCDDLISNQTLNWKENGGENEPSVEDKDAKRGLTLKDTDGKGMILRIVGEPEAVTETAKRLLEGRNSVVETLQKYKGQIDTLKEIANTLAQSNSIASASVGLVSKIWEKCKNILDLDDALIELLKDIIDFLPDLVIISENAKLPTLKGKIAEIEKEISEAVVFIENFRAANFAANAVSATRIDDGENIVKEISRLRDSLLRKMNVQQLQQIAEANRQISDAADKKLLERLNPVSSPDTNHQHNPCLKDTRVAIINEMTSWVSDNDTTMFWLSGLPGVGKSTITCSVVESLRASGVPTVPFFCQRNNRKYNDAKRVIQSMIYYLACRLPVFREHLLLELGKNDFDGTPFEHYSSTLRDIVHASLEATQYNGPAVFIVDALDECGGKEEQLTLAKDLLNATQKCSWLKVIVTSRPYENIGGFFTTVEESRIREITYKMSSNDPMNLFDDLVKYTEHRFNLSLMKERSKIELLARNANGLFQWVTVASQFIENSVNKKAALNTLLNQKYNTNVDAMEQLYVLYREVITECINLKLKANASAYSIFLTTLIALKTPLDSKAMLALVDNLDPDTIEEMCKSLRSVINIEESGLIVIAHQSFADYLSTAPQHNLLSPQLRINLALANANLVSKCLDVMLSGLKFNICALETSARFNKEIPDLQDKVKRCIPAHLQYACLHWLDHYTSAESPSLDEAKLMALLSTETILFWLEVLSVTGNIEVGMQIKHLNGSQEVKTFAGEVHNFVKAFIVPMARSTPHLYLSTLPFVPRQSPIYNMAKTRFAHLVDVITGYDNYWNITSMVLQCQDFVNAVAFSPNGRWIVSGCGDGKIQFWDAVTGSPIGEPLKGHSGSVNSVAFSAEGTKIVSKSIDETVRLWDVQTGKPIGEPLKGHSGPVTSVAFSPDGSKIVSGSSDKTIRLWDVLPGMLVGEPLRGHSKSVSSVAFSPDGAKIVSGSGDKTIRLWDVLTGKQVGEPLRGHSGPVESVAFSPEGTKVVSGSLDKTVRVWDVQTGKAIGNPLEGHSDWVHLVAFSADGTRIVSGSSDSTVRVRYVQTGKPVGEPLEGHSDWVHSASFSPDGSKIVSGSGDNTIRVWDAETKTVQTSGGTSGGQYQMASSTVASRTAHPFRKYCRKLKADGWMYLEDGKSPLLWVPTDLRHGVRSGLSYSIGLRSDERVVVLDFSVFEYGEKWIKIFK